jgi:tetratricopeptide (TPR) repeat protein
MRARFAFVPSLSAVLVAAALAAPAARPALAADPAAVAAAKSALAAAVNAGDAKAIVAARGAFAVLAAAEPAVTAFDYWTALAAWRAVPMMTGEAATKEQAKKLCKDAIDRCDRVLRAEPKHADAMALKAGLQGLWLSFDPAAMMTLGMEMEQSFARARELAPGNPRVAFLDGLNTLHKPAFVGGGADKARARFDEAIALFEKAAPGISAAAAARAGDPAAFDWGHDDACVWAGRAAMKEKDYAGAKAYYEHALAANPANGWVRTQLLPQAEKQLAEKAGS